MNPQQPPWKGGVLPLNYSRTREITGKTEIRLEIEILCHLRKDCQGKRVKNLGLTKVKLRYNKVISIGNTAQNAQIPDAYKIISARLGVRKS